MDASQAYVILNLKPSATHIEVKTAYRRLVLESHPDKNDSEQEGKKFKIITEAYHVLKNNKNHNNTGQKKHTDLKKQQEPTSKWNTQHSDKTPEEDWGRYTKQTEQSDPHFWQEYASEFWKSYETAKSNRTKNQYDFEITQEKEPNLFSSVEHSLCIGCCSCETIAPKVFHVNKSSKMNPKSNVIDQTGASAEKIMDAAQTCPTKAIRVEEKDTGKRLYPY
jgi:DnaJ-class molecular chaperone